MQGIIGARGPKGDKGEITAISTTTGAPGSQASVTNSGNTTDAELAFVIPEGLRGFTGTIEANYGTGGSGPNGETFTLQEETGNTFIGGTLDVNGTLTCGSFSVGNTGGGGGGVSVSDSVLVIGSDSATDSNDRGIGYKYLDIDGITAKQGFFGKDRDTNEFTFIPDATSSNSEYSGTVGNARFNDMVLNGDLTVTGNEITFGNTEKIENTTNGQIDITADTKTTTC